MEHTSTAQRPDFQTPKPSRLVLRAGVWYADGAPCSSYRDALARTLHAAHIQPRGVPVPPKRKPRKPRPSRYEAPEPRRTVEPPVVTAESRETLIERFLRTRAKAVVHAGLLPQAARVKGASA